MEEEEIIHTPCGLNVELCICPDATIIWDDELAVFVINEDAE